MNISHADHIYLKLREVFMRVSVQILRLLLPFYVYHEIYFYVFYIPKQKKLHQNLAF